MATRVLNQDKVVELLRKYRPALTIEKGAGGTATAKFTCPFHNDTNPSFTFTFSKDVGYCFACHARTNLVSIIRELEQISEEKAAKIVSTCLERVVNTSVKKKNLVDVSQAQIETWHDALETDTKLKVQMAKWGWDKELQDRYLLGSSEGRLTIPMFEDEVVVGVKFYTPGSTGIKYQNMPGSSSVCWPLANLEEEKVYLVEGEKDCLTMLGAGLNAVTFTTGAGKIPMDYIRYFAGKEVCIIYDVDEAGRKGAVAVATTLSFAARSIKIIDLPLTGKPKGDVTDLYISDPESFAEQIEYLERMTELYQAPAVTTRVVLPPETIRTYLEDIVKDKLFYKRVRLKVRIVNVSLHETTVVPKDILITCNKDWKDGVCGLCPLFFKDQGLNVNVRPEYPEIMSMIGNNNKVQREAIRSMTQIPEGCPKFKIEQKTHQSLYPIVIIPAIEADKKTHNYQMFTAWALDVPSQENEDYDVEGVVLANPETQKLELLCHKMEKDVASIDSFELTDEMIKRLEVFQCEHHLSEPSRVS